MKPFLKRWLITAVALLLAAAAVSTIHFDTVGFFGATVLLTFLNERVRPIMVVLALPLLVMTLGLFFFVINALLLYFVGHLFRTHFYVETFGSALLASLIMSISGLFLNSMTRSGGSKIQFHRRKPAPRPPREDDKGPVIDV